MILFRLLAICIVVLACLACEGGEPPRALIPSETPPTIPAGGTAIIEINTNGDRLEYDSSALMVKASDEVILIFNNSSLALEHNWVLVKDGTKDEVAVSGVTAGAGNDWIPRNDQRVIAHSTLIGPLETVEVRFTAPPLGTYQFVCTFPGHSATMFGVLDVVK